MTQNVFHFFLEELQKALKLYHSEDSWILVSKFIIVNWLKRRQWWFFLVWLVLALDKMSRVFRVQISRGGGINRRWRWGRGGQVTVIVVTSEAFLCWIDDIQAAIVDFSPVVTGGVLIYFLRPSESSASWNSLSLIQRSWIACKDY